MTDKSDQSNPLNKNSPSNRNNPIIETLMQNMSHIQKQNIPSRLNYFSSFHCVFAFWAFAFERPHGGAICPFIGFSLLCFIMHGDDLMPLLFIGLTDSQRTI